MKGAISLILSLLLVSLLTACGGSAPADDSGKTPETLIQEGDNALAAGDPYEASQKYRAAGEAGEEKLTEALVQISKNYTVGDPGENSVKIAMDHLCSIPESGRAREDVAERMLEVADQYMTILGENKYADPDEMYMPAKDLLDNILYNDLPEYDAITEKLALQWALAHIDNWDAEKVLPVWEQFSEHPTIAAATEAAKLFEQKRFTQGLSVLMENAENYQEYDWILIQHMASCEDTSLSETIDLMAAVATVYPYHPGGMDAQGTWIEEAAAFTDAHGTIEKQSETADLTEEEIQTLQELCGKEPAGKILMLSRRKEYEAEETKLELSCLMNSLPTDYIPAGLEQVEYVVLIDNDYVDTGETFQIGTKLLKETAMVQVYKAGNPNPIYTSPVSETVILPNTMLVYNGEPPVYNVPSHPHIGGEMTDALKTIMKDIY